MKTILALSLIAAAFAFVPSAEASCDPATGQVCAGSYSYGTCDNGGAGNYAYAYNSDATGYTQVYAGTYCYGYPGYYAVGGVGGGVFTCDPSWSCDQAGADWSGGNFFGSPYCYSQAYTYVDGQYTGQALPLCDVAGAPPAIPSLGLP